MRNKERLRAIASVVGLKNISYFTRVFRARSSPRRCAGARSRADQERLSWGW
jgi:AraC-like DNA-binding protein